MKLTEMEIERNYYPSIIGLSLFGILVIFTIIKQNNIEKEISQNRHKTIALIYDTGENRTIDTVYYSYYFQGKRMVASESTDYNVSKLKDKYFNVHLSELNPDLSLIQLNEEVRDTTKIIAAGFTLKRKKKKAPKKNQFQNFK